MEGYHRSHLFFRLFLASRHTFAEKKIIYRRVSTQALQQKQTDLKQRRDGDIERGDAWWLYHCFTTSFALLGVPEAVGLQL